MITIQYLSLPLSLSRLSTVARALCLTRWCFSLAQPSQLRRQLGELLRLLRQPLQLLIQPDLLGLDLGVRVAHQLLKHVELRRAKPTLMGGDVGGAAANGLLLGLEAGGEGFGGAADGLLLGGVAANGLLLVL
eukprot:2121708-Heterocapsa_arctica.AAC.1